VEEEKEEEGDENWAGGIEWSEEGSEVR